MEIIKKIQNKNVNIISGAPVTLAFLGDSVTHGCFECYFDEEAHINTFFKPSASYTQRVREMLNIIYPSAQINIVNSGTSGDNTFRGIKRFDRDITKFSPDLVVISYGLNDACSGLENIKSYTDNLRILFNRVKEIGAECIYLTENMMCTKVSCHLKDDLSIKTAKGLSNVQNSGVLDKYFEEGKKVANEYGIKVCDIYSWWKKMHENGVDTTELLANRFNHPIETMHYYTAIKLVETMFD